MNLTIYMFQESVTSFEKAMKANALKTRAYTQRHITLDDFPLEGTAYIKSAELEDLSWAKFFAQGIDLKEDELQSGRSGLVLLLRYQDRIFGVTAGLGFSAINADLIEHDFGLKVALSELSEEEFLGIDSRSLELRTSQKREISSIAGRFEEFDFDSFANLLGRVVGKGTQGAIGKSIVGSDSLRITDSLNFMDISNKIVKAYKTFKSDRYKEQYSFIENVRLVKQSDIKLQLEHNIEHHVASGNHQGNIILSCPNIDIASHASYYRVIANGKSEFYDSLDTDEIIKYVLDCFEGNFPYSKCHIQAYDCDDNELGPSLNMKNYISFENTIEGDVFLLTSGKWYKINSGFSEHIQGEIKNIEFETSILPPLQSVGRAIKKDKECIKIENEASYNSRSSQLLGFINMDTVTYKNLPGHSSVECCDLYDPNGKLIHIKKFDGSSVLSHLFNQGYVSAELLKGENDALNWFCNHINNRGCTLEQINSNGQFCGTIVYGIIGIKGNLTLDRIPFFSKVSLNNIYKKMKTIGIKVEFSLSGLEILH